MIFSIFLIILITISLWSISRFIRYNQKEDAILLTITVIIFITHQVLDYLLYNGQELYGYKGVIGNLISCCFLPMCYLTTRKLCHIKKMSASTVCLFMLAFVNVFTKMTVFTDYAPVSHILDDINIQFYSKGKLALYMEVPEFVTILQLLWITERIMRFGYKVKRDHLHITTKATRATSIVLIYVLISLLSLTIPFSYETHIKVGFIMQIVDFVCMSALVIFIALGDSKFFIIDENDEMVYFGEIPNYKKMKRQLDNLVVSQKIHRNPDVKISIIARLLDTNSLTVSKMLKEECDMTFNAYIVKARIDDAMDLIKKDPGMPLSDVATTCGFNSAVNFSKAFRKVMGITAKDWSAQ